MRTLHAAAAMAMILMPTVARSVEFGDAQQGLVYARQVCTECHAVDADDEISPNPDAPSFSAVANTPGMSPRALVVWLQSPHPTMPSLMLPPDVSDNVIAYIMSLREKQ